MKTRTAISAALLTSLVALAGAGHAAAAAEKVQVVATLNVLASVTSEIGGDRVSVTALAKPNQDPHTLVAKPTFKLAAKNARLFVELGLDLDKWGSAVTDASGNPAIQVGQAGRVVASEGVPSRELPTTLSKAWGDIHPYGNPHGWMSPHALDSVVGSSLDGTPSDATTRPAWPTWIAGLPDASVTALPHLSRSSPSSTNNRAFLAASLKVGLATRVCGSWFGLASAVTLTRSPPISLVTEASTLSVATTWTFSAAAAAWPAPASATSDVRRAAEMAVLVFMVYLD